MERSIKRETATPPKPFHAGQHKPREKTSVPLSQELQRTLVRFSVHDLQVIECHPLFFIVALRRIGGFNGDCDSMVVALLLVAATVLIHNELLQFASTLPSRLKFPMHSRVIIVIGVVVVAHAIEASLCRFVLCITDAFRYGRPGRPSGE